MATVVDGVVTIHRALLALGLLVLCHALTLPNVEALLHKVDDALSRIGCLEEELHRYKIDGTYCGKVNRVTKIVGGDTTEKNEYPWQVAVVKHGSSQVLCGGCLINDRWILTAAHCQVKIRDYQVILGNHYQESVDQHEVRKDLKMVVQHPDFNKTNWDNDFSLLELVIPLNLKTLRPAITPVCLPRRGNPFQFDNVTSIITGWGRTSSGGLQSNSLREAIVKTMDNTRCSTLYSKSIRNSMICASYPNRDTCQGDSGGPLITENCGYHYLIGITSWGKGCAEDGYPGVYARVTDALDWISETATTSSNTDNNLITFPSNNMCKFPFKYDGVTYNQCTTRGHCGVFWCSTRTDENNNHKPGHWTECNGNSSSLVWGKTIHACIYGHNNKELKDGISFEDCKKACADEREFICRSVDYWPGGHGIDLHCQLSTSDSTSDNFHEPCPSPYEQENLYAENSNLAWQCVGPTDRFVVFEQQMSWLDARALCKRYSLDLYIPGDTLAVAKYLEEEFNNPDYWLGGRGNTKHLVWITGSVVPKDGPWYSVFNDYNVRTTRCLAIRTSGNHVQNGKVLASSDCTNTSPYVLCG